MNCFLAIYVYHSTSAICGYEVLFARDAINHPWGLDRSHPGCRTPGQRASHIPPDLLS